MTREPTDFLYPFIDPAGHSDPARSPAGVGGQAKSADVRHEDTGRLLADLAWSADAKAKESERLRTATLAAYDRELDEIATRIGEAFTAGHRLFTFGNGGSATDAACFAALFTSPPHGRPLPARSLVAENATLTALGNDVGFDLVFSRQLIAYGMCGDVAMGFSTSGNSENVVTAFAEARRRGMVTIGLAGYDGGQMASCGHLDHCLVVASDSVHRIQETQDALTLSLWLRVQARAAEGAA